MATTVDDGITEVNDSENINPLEDRMSQLPDDILVDILSLLEIKEVGRSSVFSSRWRNLWKFVTCLIFVYARPSYDPENDVKNRLLAKNEFVTRVSKVMNTYEGSCLNEFVVRFNYDDCFSRDVDEWIQFVIQKRVKKLEIDFMEYFSCDLYTLSNEHNCLFFKNPLNLSSLECLTSLNFKGVSIDDELMGYLLINCVQLESLCVSWCKQLVNVKVTEASCNLKHLELIKCESMESLEVSAPKLVSLKYIGRTIKYIGRKIEYRFGYLPHLVKLCIEDGFSDIVTAFSGYLSQLHTIEIKMSLDNTKLPQIPELTNLKCLKIVVDFSNLWNIFRRYDTLALMEAAPSLHSLTYEILSPQGKVPPLKSKYNRIHPHHGLKIVEIYGFWGGTIEHDIASCLISNAVNLEIVTIHPYSRGRPVWRDLRRTRKWELALEHENLLPPGATLIVI